MATIDPRAIHAAFSPAKEIVDPQHFVGRTEEIKKAIHALLNPGGFISVFGLRGVGKSSIAHQLKLIAEGDERLPKSLGLARSLPTKKFNYIVHYYKSDGFIANIHDLVKRMLFGDEDNPSLFTLTNSGDKKISRVQTNDQRRGFSWILRLKNWFQRARREEVHSLRVG